MPDRFVEDWRTLVSQTAPATRQIISDIVIQHEHDLRQRYGSYLLADPELAELMHAEDIRHEFSGRFVEWVKRLVDPNATAGDRFFTEQRQIGELLARIGFPPHALARSTRKLKLWFLRHLAERNVPREQLVDMMTFIISLFDIALEVRETSYQQEITVDVRVTEAYRLHLLGQNLAMERERQRAALMEWGHAILAAFYQRVPAGSLPKLWKADFGLWLNHKAHILFEREPKLARIRAAVDRVDTQLVPRLQALTFENPEDVRETTRQIEEEIASIKFLVNTIFDEHIEIESGRDPLTRLLTRRFMPSVLMREVHLQKAPNASGFCVLLIDVDHFKTINDTYGHKAGDQALSLIAAAINDNVRQTDFVFRYGGEEILVLLIECDERQGLQRAEKIRIGVENLVIPVADGVDVSVTVSIGLAAFQGELDYKAILTRADRAVYEAKSLGRNRVVIADPRSLAQSDLSTVL